MQKLMIYYSGHGCPMSNPEVFLKERANLMLTYADSIKKVHPRFAAIHKKRSVKWPRKKGK